MNYMNNLFKIDNNSTILRCGNIYALGIVHNNAIIHFRCSAKILPLELGVIAEKLNLPKKLELDHSKITLEYIKSPSAKSIIRSYCERDATIVHRFMFKIGICLNNYIPQWWIHAYSISGIAIMIFKNHFNKFNIPFSIDITLDESLRPAYYGGRCEIFGNPYIDEKIFHFDFSGMYTNTLKESYPYGKYIKKIKPTSIDYPGFYSVSVYSNLSVPILPYRDPLTGKLLFPNGRFVGLYWHEELKLFLENDGIITDIFWSIEFEKNDYIFSDFAKNCTKLRGTSLTSNIIWKLIPNSFIGRLGLKPEYEKTIVLDDFAYNPIDLNVISDRQINNQWIVRLKTFSNPLKINGNVIYPAIITAKARIRWWKAAVSAIQHGGRLLYCDTDSLFVCFNKNVSGEQHGEIFWDPKKDDTVINSACFATSKVYSIQIKNKTITKIKGVPNKSVKMSFEDFEKLFYNNKKSIINMVIFNKFFNNMKITEIKKIIDFGGYDKRIFYDNKKKTKTLII